MIISDTSALVLNWTTKDVWTTKQALDYLSGLDLSAADDLLHMFNETEYFMHTQAVSNRKFFMRKCAIEFLNQCREKDAIGQVIILAAGIAPLSVEIASLYPECFVFDIDKYLMAEKAVYLDNSCPGIRFISCDITDTVLLSEELAKNGWDNTQPTLLIMEGIIYYLSEDKLRNILNLFSPSKCKLACDFGLKPDYVNISNRTYGIDLFRKIQELVGLDSVNLYDPSYFMTLLKGCGFENTVRLTMGDVQEERTGKKSPFEEEESGWISVASNQ